MNCVGRQFAQKVGRDECASAVTIVYGISLQSLGIAQYLINLECGKKSKKV